jgi:hypothetical protein
VRGLYICKEGLLAPAKISHSLPASLEDRREEGCPHNPAATTLQVSKFTHKSNAIPNVKETIIFHSQPRARRKNMIHSSTLAASKDVCPNPIQSHACVCLPFHIPRHANAFPLYPPGIQFVSPPANLSTLPYDLGKQTAKSMRAGYTSPKAGSRRRNAVRRNLFGNQGEVVDE